MKDNREQLNILFERFKNSDSTLTADQKIVIEQDLYLQKEIDDILIQISTLDKEIKERESKIDSLLQQFNFKKGELQGYENVLLKLQEETK